MCVYVCMCLCVCVFVRVYVSGVLVSCRAVACKNINKIKCYCDTCWDLLECMFLMRKIAPPAVVTMDGGLVAFSVWWHSW